MRKRSVSHSIVVASVASLTALYRKFKHPFSDGSYIAEPVSRQSHLYLVKNRGFTWITRAMQRSEALALFPVGAVSHTHSGRHRRLNYRTSYGRDGTASQLRPYSHLNI